MNPLDLSVQLRRATIRVGGGRGFVIAHGEARLVLTAAHCLPRLPEPVIDEYAGIYPNLLGRLDGKRRRIWAECRFVDPIADLAVFAVPDPFVFDVRSRAYERWTARRATLTFAAAGVEGAVVYTLGLNPTRLIKGTLRLWEGRLLMQATDGTIKPGMSGLADRHRRGPRRRAGQQWRRARRPGPDGEPRNRAGVLSARGAARMAGRRFRHQRQDQRTGVCGLACGLGRARRAGGAQKALKSLVPPVGLEPTTYGLQNRCSAN